MVILSKIHKNLIAKFTLIKISIEDILNENLYLSQRELLIKYKNDKSSDQLRIELVMITHFKFHNFISNFL
jgi:hypothetical protein